MFDTRYKLLAVIAVTTALGATSGATAAEIPVLGPGGLSVRDDPGVAVRDRTVGVADTHREHRSAPLAVASSAARARTKTPPTVLKGLYARGALDRASFLAARDAYSRARRLGRRLPGRRGLELRGVVADVAAIAARNQLTASRVPVLTLTLERNAQWWGGSGSLLAAGARISFSGSELVWQSVPGQGIQFHPLANFGKLNALWRSKLEQDRMAALLDELLPLQASRAGGTAWEYYYDFDGGRPPWTSSLSQGTGLQSTARAAVKAGRGPELIPQLANGLAIFRTRPPEGVRVAAPGGRHYAQYSFWPGLRILNGYIQSLVGLYDFAQLSGDPVAARLFAEGEAAARREVPTYDTGAWSLYSRGSISRESDLNYHKVLIEFLQSLCDRTKEATYCDAVASFTDELRVAPTLSLVTRTLRAGARGRVRVRLSKIARVRVQLRRGGRLVYDASTVQGYGTRSWSVTPPRSTRGYDVTISATDLAGNTAEPVEGTIEVLAPRKRRP